MRMANRGHHRGRPKVRLRRMCFAWGLFTGNGAAIEQERPIAVLRVTVL